MMKKIALFLLAGVTGGVFSLVAIHFFKPETQTVYVRQAPTVSDNFHVQKAKYIGNIDFTIAAENTVNSVVHVKVRNERGSENPFYSFLYGKPQKSQDQPPIVSTGSGVIISNDGYIVTNNHVIDGADILEVTLDDKRTFTAKVVGADPTTDIALIKIKGEELPFLKWGNSDDLRVGEWVLAVGNPFNLASTVTAGIVSAKARSINIFNKSTAIEAFIQTDAAVNPGNSGGALVNIEGELVGINTAIASPTGSFAGYSFAVPERIARKIVSDLLEFGAVQRAFIGVSIKDVTSEEAKKSGVHSTQGVFISGVSDGGAAADAGIRSGDVILSVSGIIVNTMSELQEQVGQYRPGDQLNVIIKRGDKEKELLITLRNSQGNTDITKGETAFKMFGSEFKPVSSEIASSLKINGGIQVVSIEEGKFKQAGIKEGFIITQVNRKNIYSLDDLRVILKNSTGGIKLEGIYPNGYTAYYAFGI